VFLLCDDNLEYVVKGSQAGRMIFNDQVVARLGTAMGAPVGSPKLVDVPVDLIHLQPEMAPCRQGSLPEDRIGDWASDTSAALAASLRRSHNK
jgi:hypothetical protein